MGINDNNKDELSNSYNNLIDQKLIILKENGRNRTLIILLATILFLFTNVLFYILGLNSASGSYLSSNNGSSLSRDIRDYRKFILVRSILGKSYNGEYDSNKLIDDALRGMVDSLNDPYTVYMDREEFYDFNLRSKGHYIGIGIQVAAKDGKVCVVSVFDNSPAQEVGIRVGDYIVEVLGEKISDEKIERAISLINKGEEDTNVSLVIERKGEEIPLDIFRRKIDILPVEYERLEDDILYLKINSFDENSYNGVKKALSSFDSKGIIIDLRGNPGGLLNECVDIVSEFLEEGKIVVSTGDKHGNKEVIKAISGDFGDVPIVVLGDSGSASASEVLIGALKDHGRATFIGSRTFGKGLVQKVFKFEDGSGLKVTISKYYTPNGDYINNVGIEPDINIEYSQEQQLQDKEEAEGDEEILKKMDPQYQKALEIIKEKMGI